MLILLATGYQMIAKPQFPMLPLMVPMPLCGTHDLSQLPVLALVVPMLPSGTHHDLNQLPAVLLPLMPTIPPLGTSTNPNNLTAGTTNPNINGPPPEYR
jgi:hypothetical protein